MASAAMLLADSARDGSAEVSSTSIVAAGHYLAMEAGREILAGGGNAIDAGVAAGVALAVVQSEQVQFAGVAPILAISSRVCCSRSPFTRSVSRSMSSPPMVLEGEEHTTTPVPGPEG